MHERLASVSVLIFLLLFSCGKKEKVRAVYQFPAVLKVSSGSDEDGRKTVKGDAAASVKENPGEIVSSGESKQDALYAEITLEEAAAAYEKTLGTDPDNFEVYYNLGSIYSELGLYERALESYVNAVRLRPGHAELHYNKGLTHLMNDDRKSALEEFKTLRKLDKGMADRLYEATVQSAVWKSNYYIQAAEYENAVYAVEMLEKLKDNLVCAFIEKEKKFSRVIIPGIKTVNEGKMMMKELESKLVLDPFLLKAFKVQ